MLAMLLCALMAMPANVLTVDDSGGAQFTTIQAAIDAASPGDVLEIAPGNYAGFTLAKDLVLVGPGVGAHPQVAGLTTLSATDFALSALDFARVAVSGAGAITDCTIGGTTDTNGVALQIAPSAGLLVAHCKLLGEDDAGGVACSVSSSLVAFTACTIRGGKGFDVVNGQGGNAGDGLDVTGASHVTIAECAVVGGQAGFGNQFLNPWNGKPGDGLHSSQSTVVVRGGTSFAELLSGFTDDPHGPVGHGLAVTGGKVSVSDTFFDAAEVLLTSGGKLLQPAQPEPLLDLDGGVMPDDFVHLRIFGPAGAPAVLFAGDVSGLLTLAKLEAPLWLAPGLALPLVTTGQQTPIDVQVRLPDDAALIGSTWRVQAAFPGLSSVMTPGKILVSNPAAIVVRF
jgi:hypothetical protein